MGLLKGREKMVSRSALYTPKSNRIEEKQDNTRHDEKKKGYIELSIKVTIGDGTSEGAGSSDNASEGRDTPFFWCA